MNIALGSLEDLINEMREHHAVKRLAGYMDGASTASVDASVDHS